MALEVSYVGRFAQGGGLDDLAQPPYDVGRFRPRFVPYAYDQALNRARRAWSPRRPTSVRARCSTARTSWRAPAWPTPTCTPSWEAYVEAGSRIKAATGAYLIAHAQAQGHRHPHRA